MNISKKIILALLLCTVVQKTLPVFGLILNPLFNEIKESSLTTKCGLALAAAAAGKCYLYQNPEIEEKITQSWAWKSKTALAVGAGTIWLTDRLPEIVGFESITFLKILKESYPSIFPVCLRVAPVPFLALGAWTASEGFDWLTYKNKSKNFEKRNFTEWEKEFYKMSLDTNGYQFNSYKSLLDARKKIIEDHGFEVFQKHFIPFLAYSVISIFNNHLDGQICGADIITILVARLKEREEEIKAIDKSTGLIAFLAKQVPGTGPTFEDVVNSFEKIDAGFDDEEHYIFENLEECIPHYYKDGSDLSLFMHVHSFGKLEGFSWNKKIDFQWALLKDYAYLELLFRMIRFSLCKYTSYKKLDPSFFRSIIFYKE